MKLLTKQAEWVYHKYRGLIPILYEYNKGICVWFIIFIRSYQIQCTVGNAYFQISNISGTLVGNKIIDHSDVVGASPVGAAPTTSSFST